MEEFGDDSLCGLVLVEGAGELLFCLFDGFFEFEGVDGEDVVLLLDFGEVGEGGLIVSGDVSGEGYVRGGVLGMGMRSLLLMGWLVRGQ